MKHLFLLIENRISAILENGRVTTEKSLFSRLFYIYRMLHFFKSTCEDTKIKIQVFFF